GADVVALETAGADPGLEDVTHENQAVAPLGRERGELVHERPGGTAGTAQMGIREESDAHAKSIRSIVNQLDDGKARLHLVLPRDFGDDRLGDVPEGLA